MFGHWIDFWQMVMPGTLNEKAQLMPFEFGIAALFIGIIMWRVGVYFTKSSINSKKSSFPERKYDTSYLMTVNRI